MADIKTSELVAIVFNIVITHIPHLLRKNTSFF